MHLITLQLSSSLTIVGLVQLAIIALSVSRPGYILALGGLFVLEKGIQILLYAQQGHISRKKLNLIARAAPLGMLVLIRACMFQDYALQDLSVKSLVSLSLISPALRVIFVLKALQPLQLHVVAQDHLASYFRR